MFAGIRRGPDRVRVRTMLRVDERCPSGPFIDARGRKAAASRPRAGRMRRNASTNKKRPSSPASLRTICRPLLPSGPGGVRQRPVAQDLTSDNTKLVDLSRCSGADRDRSLRCHGTETDDLGSTPAIAAPGRLNHLRPSFCIRLWMSDTNCGADRDRPSRDRGTETDDLKSTPTIVVPRQLHHLPPFFPHLLAVQ